MIYTQNNPYSKFKNLLSYVDLKDFSSGKVLASPMVHSYFQALKFFIQQDGYPCVGAQTSLNSKSLALGIFDGTDEDAIVRNLAYGLSRYLHEMLIKPSNYLSFIAILPNLKFADEVEFEVGLWRLLNALARLDGMHHEWDPHVSQNPKENNFSFSFGGKAFFLVGMHPKSSRRARRFQSTAIAFNLQEQFDVLRTKGRFETMQKCIRDREIIFDGEINPMLTNFGEGLQAPQYSGRKVEGEWKCPFAPPASLKFKENE